MRNGKGSVSSVSKNMFSTKNIQTIFQTPHASRCVTTDVLIYPNTVVLKSPCRGVAADDVCFNVEVVLFDRLCYIHLAVKQVCFGKIKCR